MTQDSSDFGQRRLASVCTIEHPSIAIVIHGDARGFVAAAVIASYFRCGVGVDPADGIVTGIGHP